MLRRIVLSRTTGQLGNRLIVGAHVLAAAYEYGIDCLNPTLLQYSEWFAGTKKRLMNWTSVPSAERTIPSWQRSAAYTITRGLWQAGKILCPLSFGRISSVRAPARDPQDLQVVLSQAQFRGVATLLLQGYYFRHYPWAERHANRIRAFFSPLDEYRRAGEAAIAALRRDREVIVGVHLRHGDYRTFLDGRYFWDVSIYRSFMERIQGLLSPKRVGFLLCSNEKHAANSFSGMECKLGPGSVPGDLHALSCCDYVMGPPSSFSAWAAFMSGTRLFHLMRPDHDFKIEDFTKQKTPHPPLE